MSPIGNGNPGQPGHPPGGGQPHQVSINTATSGGNVFSAQGGNIHIGTVPSKRGPRTDTKVLLVTLLLDVVVFLYGMLAYTGTNTSGDTWRAGITVFLFLATCGMIGRWIRRRT